MEQHRIEVLLEAEQPIKHLAETFGNQGILATRNVRQPDGTVARVPIVSADALRHGIREAAAHVMLSALGADERPQLSEAALRLLFAGGMVTGKGDAGSVRMGEYRKLVEMVPQLGFLGGCAQNRTIPGCLDVEDATLICAESVRRVPGWILDLVAAEYGSPQAASYRQSVEEVQRVRMDPSLVPERRALLAPEVAEAIERRLEANEKASEEDDAAGALATKSSMLPRRSERVIDGSLWTWGVTVNLYGALDADAFYTAFCAFAARMVVGGGRATGHGRMKVVRAQRTVLRSHAEVPQAEEVGLTRLGPGGALSPTGARVGELFVDHVRARSKEIVDFLRTVNA